MKRIELYVAVDGTDTGTGTTRRPLRSLHCAQLAVREILRRNEGWPRVTVRPGVYSLETALEFGPEDAGPVGWPVVWRAAGAGGVVLAGGRRLMPQWRKHGDGVQVAGIGRDLAFDQLFVDGRRQTLARYPTYQPGEILGGYAADAVSPDRAARWRNPETGFVRALHPGAWGGNSYRITGKGENGPCLAWVGDNNRGDGMHDTCRMVEGIFEELDSPGEWFYDRTAGKLYFYPPDDIDLATAAVQLGEREELIRIVGTGSSPAGGLVLSGFTFTATHRTLFTRPYEPLLLGDWAVARAGAIYLKNAARVRIEQCRFTELGGNAVFLDGYNSGHVITGNTFTGSGASDVLAVGARASVRVQSTWDAPRRRLHDRAPGPRTEDFPREITVSGNRMTGCGEYEKQSAAVHLSASLRITVRGNTIHRVPRAGININDGTWGGHLIEGNDIFDCVRETSDHGPINAWGRDRYWPLDADDATKARHSRLDALETTVIRGNRIHHLGDWGIDLDDGASNYLLSRNLLLDCGIKLREGFDRHVTGNMLIGGSTHHHVSYAGNKDRVEHNVFLGPIPYRFIRSDPERGRGMFDHNLFWNDGAQVHLPDGAWREKGYDLSSRIADPCFDGSSPWQDPARGHYPLSEASPAFTVGFADLPDVFGAPGAPVPPPITWHAWLAAETEGTRELLGAQATGIRDERVKSATGLTDAAGLYLAHVPNQSEAFRQGLRTNDVIRILDGVPIGADEEFWAHYDRLAPATGIAAVIWRDQRSATLTLTKPSA